jgi:hypothetical protein
MGCINARYALATSVCYKLLSLSPPPPWFLLKMHVLLLPFFWLFYDDVIIIAVSCQVAEWLMNDDV